MEGTSIEDEIFACINELRKDPKIYAEHLKKRLETYKGNEYVDTKGTCLGTVEGKAPCIDAIALLETTAPLPPFELVPELVKAARVHCDDLSKTGDYVHTGSDRSTVQTRIERYGSLEKGTCAQSIAFQSQTGLDFVLQWLVGDGAKNRYDRGYLLSNKYKYVGIAFNPTHKKMKRCATIVFTERFLSKEAEADKKVAENPNVDPNVVPAELSKLPPGAKEFSIARKTEDVGTKKKTTYTATYTMEDGSKKDVTKEIFH